MEMGSSSEREVVPLDEAELNALERGVIARARRAGFEVEALRGTGPAGSSTRVVGRLGGVPSGLVRFSITRTIPAGKADVWVKFVHWPARKAMLAEVRAELEQMIQHRGSR